MTEREKNELLNYAKSIAVGSDMHIIDSIDEYKQRLKEMCSINYPISEKIECVKLNISEFSRNIDFNDGDTIILPYFNNTKYWIKMVIDSFSIICINKKIIYDIELGELEYEIRICYY